MSRLLRAREVIFGEHPTVVAAIWLVLIIIAMAWLLVASPDDVCDRCPRGSIGRLVRGYYGGPMCICEVVEAP